MRRAERTVANGDVMLAASTAGAGQKVIFFNGIASTQIIWKPVINHLEGSYEVVTFDFRNHGKSSASRDHSFGAFMSDAECIMKAFGSGKPILVAWSFGADLAVAYAAAHPGSLRGLLIVDGALPLSAPLVEDERGMRRLLNSFSMKVSVLLMRATAYRYDLSGDAIADIALELDARRQDMGDIYAGIDCPISMVLATRTAGANSTAHNRRNNALWRAAGERLAAAHPAIRVSWIDAGHRLPLTNPKALAKEIEALAVRALDVEKASSSADRPGLSKAESKVRTR